VTGEAPRDGESALRRLRVRAGDDEEIMIRVMAERPIGEGARDAAVQG
jgi:hypothetical protein